METAATNHSNMPSTSSANTASSVTPQQTQQQNKIRNTATAMNSGVIHATAAPKDGQAATAPQGSQQQQSAIPSTCIGTSTNPSDPDRIDGFLLEALKNIKDRTFILKIEHTVTLFMADPEPVELEFPPMNSYYRMLAHHVAGYYNLGHFVDNTSKCLVLQKNEQSVCPVLRLYDLVEPMEQMMQSTMMVQTMHQQQGHGHQQQGWYQNQQGYHHPQQHMRIKRREDQQGQGTVQSSIQSQQQGSGQNVSTSLGKTLEQREADYEAAKQRIFAEEEGEEEEAPKKDTTRVEDKLDKLTLNGDANDEFKKDQEITAQKDQEHSSATPSASITSSNTLDESKKKSPSFNPNATPFVPESFAASPGGGSGAVKISASTASTPGATSSQSPTRVINIIDPTAAKPPGHIVCISLSSSTPLQLPPDVAFRPKLHSALAGYLIFSCADTAKTALTQSPCPYSSEATLSSWSPVISD